MITNQCTGENCWLNLSERWPEKNQENKIQQRHSEISGAYGFSFHIQRSSYWLKQTNYTTLTSMQPTPSTLACILKCSTHLVALQEEIFFPILIESVRSEAYWEPSRTSAMEFLVKIVNTFQQLSIFAKKLDRRFLFYGEKISISSFLVVLVLFLWVFKFFFQRIPFFSLYRTWSPFSFDVIFFF